MFMDLVVFAGVGTVLLMISFFAGLTYFLWKHEEERKEG